MGSGIERIESENGNWDLAEIVQCPYCASSLVAYECSNCNLNFEIKDGLYHLYDPQADHWQLCLHQLNAWIKQSCPRGSPAGHDPIGHPYVGLSSASPLAQQANVALFNISLDLFGEVFYEGTGYALDVGAFRGWASFQLAAEKKTVALDTADDQCYGIGGIPENVGKGIRRVVADGCYLPFKEGAFDIVFMCAAYHHMHDKRRALCEFRRVLRQGGILVAIGEIPQTAEQIANTQENLVIETVPPTEAEVLDYFDTSGFSDIRMLHVRYTPHMHRLGYFSLVTDQCPSDNGIYFGVK